MQMADSTLDQIVLSIVTEMKLLSILRYQHCMCVAQIHEQTASFQSTAHSFGAVLYCRISFMQIVRKESPNNFPLNHSLWHP